MQRNVAVRQQDKTECAWVALITCFFQVGSVWAVRPVRLRQVRLEGTGGKIAGLHRRVSDVPIMKTRFQLFAEVHHAL